MTFNLGDNELEGLENGANSKWVRANNGEVITFNVDQIWDPFLKHLKLRPMALIAKAMLTSSMTQSPSAAADPTVLSANWV